MPHAGLGFGGGGPGRFSGFILRLGQFGPVLGQVWGRHEPQFGLWGTGHPLAVAAVTASVTVLLRHGAGH